MKTPLHLAGPADLAAVQPQTVAQRIRSRQAEIRTLGQDQVQTLLGMMADLAQFAAETDDLGDPIPPGIRDLARRLAEDLGTRAQTINSITGKTTS